MSPGINLSAVILAKNEEENLAECLRRLGFVDEIVVIDDYSHDKTIKVARSFGAKVFKKHLEDDFAAQRNFGLERASGRWVLFVDADERVGPELKEEIIQGIKKVDTVGYYLLRRDQIFSKTLRFGELSFCGAFGSAKILRLGRKGAGIWRRRVHEYWEIMGKKGDFRSPLIHHPHPTLREFVGSINYFSSLHARAIREEGKKPTLFKIIFWPPGKFVYNMCFRLGFLDGMEGFIVALFMSFNSFLAWSKAWINQGRSR